MEIVESGNELFQISELSAPVRWKNVKCKGEESYYTLTYHWYQIDPKSITNTLRDVGGNVAVDRVRKSALGHLLDVDRVNAKNLALHRLLGCQIESEEIPSNELWFLVGGHVIKFSAKEYALISGLRFGTSTFQYDDKKYRYPPTSSLHTSHFNCKKKQKLELKRLYEDFKQKKLDCTNSYIEAALLILCFSTIQCRESCAIEAWAWHLIEDYNQWNAFPWGTFSYQMLLHYNKNVGPSSKQNKYRCNGPVWVLELWSYEVIEKLGEECAKLISRTSIPRCLKWKAQDTAADIHGFFKKEDLVVCSPLVPTPEELNTPYMMSLDGGRGDMVYKPLRKPHVKKLKEKLKEKLPLKGKRGNKIDFESMLRNKNFLVKLKRAMEDISLQDEEVEYEIGDQDEEVEYETVFHKKNSLVFNQDFV